MANYTDRVFSPTAITATNPVRITIEDNGFTGGERIRVTNTMQFNSPGGNATGMYQLEGRDFVVRFPTTDEFEIYDIYGNPIDGTSYTAFVDNGRVKVTLTGPDLNIGSEL